MKTKLAQRGGGCQNQFNLRQVGGFSQNINIALHELAVTSFLGTVCTPYVANLQCLKG